MFCKMFLEPTKDLENNVRFLKQRVYNLECKEKENNRAILEIFRISKLSDDEIYEKYKYITWDKLPELVKMYLGERFDVEFCSYAFNTPETILANINRARGDEPVGVILDRKRKLADTVVAPSNDVGEKPDKK